MAVLAREIINCSVNREKLLSVPRCLFVLSALDQDIQGITILVNGAPQVM